MPAAKAVLRDIADIGLDPCVAYTRCAQDGRLVAPVAQASSMPVLVQVVPEQVIDVVVSEKHDVPEPVKIHEEERAPVVEEKKQVVNEPEKGQSPVPPPDTKKAPKPKRQ